MSRYIKLEDAIERTNQLYHGDEVESWLESLPTIEVVRCKDCRHWDTFRFFTQTVKECAILDGRLTGENDYCSWGKRLEV